MDLITSQSIYKYINEQNLKDIIVFENALVMTLKAHYEKNEIEYNTFMLDSRPWCRENAIFNHYVQFKLYMERDDKFANRMEVMLKLLMTNGKYNLEVEENLQYVKDLIDIVRKCLLDKFIELVTTNPNLFN